MRQQPELDFDINKSTPLVCDCGNYTYTQSYIMRELSAIVSPTGRAGIIPIPIFTCNSCGAVPDELVPKFLKDESKQTEPSSAVEQPKSGLILEK
jgi:hypothetical protein